MRHLTFIRRGITAVLLLGLVPAMTGCHSWRTQTGSAESVLASRPEAGTIRVTTSPSDTIVVASPRVSSDTLYGQTGDSTTVAIALSDITSVQTKENSTGKTVLLVGGVTAVGFGVLVAATAMSLCDGSLGC